MEEKKLFGNLTVKTKRSETKLPKNGTELLKNNLPLREPND
jgi:hypothetical protein